MPSSSRPNCAKLPPDSTFPSRDLTIISLQVPIMLLDRGGYLFSPYAIPTAVTTALMLLFGVTVYVRRASRVSAAFLGLTGFASVWLFAFTFMYSARDAEHALFWARIAYLGVPFLAPAIYQFTVEMLRIMRLRRITVIIGWSLYRKSTGLDSSH